MLSDALEIPTAQALTADICIIGAGAAGITLAHALNGTSLNVLLLESGAFNAEADVLALNRGINAGLPYYPLDECRLRFFGGTTNHWGGWCLPPFPEEFGQNDWNAHSRWPISFEEIEPYYVKSLPILDLGPNEFAAPYWETPERRSLPFADDKMFTAMVQFSAPTRFGQKYREELVQSKNVTVCLHANAVGFDVNKTHSSATRLRVVTSPGNKPLYVQAKRYVVAAGGIENPRLLLMSAFQGGPGLGNRHGNVGRYFADHYMCELGELHLGDSESAPLLYLPHKGRGGQRVQGHLKPTLALRRDHKMASMWIRFEAIPNKRYDEARRSAGIDSLDYLLEQIKQGNVPDGLAEHIGRVIADIDDVAVTAYRHLRYDRMPIDYYSLGAFIDPVPNPDSRVTLAEEKDSLGLPMVKVDWKISEADWDSFRHVQEVVAAEFGRIGGSRVKLYEYERDQFPPLTRGVVSGGWHHMGTTRMSTDPKHGVVDVNCKIHGVDNVFVAGSSVFPSYECGTPTISIVALALRLADHLRESAKRA